MSLQFIVGPADADKSKYLQNALVSESLASPEQKFLLIVPDQYTMQTQKDMVLLHPDRAFSNIEVLNFSRLSHRILEEIGGEEIPVLDDTGKSLIIRHVSEEVRSNLKTMQSRIDRIGFIHEIKSALSEFLQYGIDPDGVHKLSEFADGRPMLKHKLNDLEVIYRGFLDYKKDKFLTGEETLEIVRRGIPKSKLVKHATIVFDGFTGFTPIQERVIQELMIVADKVLLSFDMDESMDPYKLRGEQELFYLPQKAISRLKKLADEAGVEEKDALILPSNPNNPRPEELIHIQKNLFRYPVKPYENKPQALRIFKAESVRDEVIDTFERIKYLTDVEGLCYRDIAIVSGNLEGYADEIIRTADSYDIPVYMDYNRAVTLSPFIEALRSVWDIIDNNFSRDSVIRFLRCGFSDIQRTECDELENYLLRTGIRGLSGYKKEWTINYGIKEDESEEVVRLRLDKMERLNDIRNRLLIQLNPLLGLKDNDTAATYSRAFYDFIHLSKMSNKLDSMSAMFGEQGDLLRESEYKQIYRKVMDLLDQVVALVGEETISLKEYKEIIEAGYGEIKLGIIPQKSDKIIVADMVRSRLSEVKVLFLIGVNDGNIPGGISSGGLISDLDREFLKESQMELSPTPKEQMYTQRLYLYMGMTKPVEKLYISYAGMDSQGKSIRPSYLIEMLCKLFPEINIEASASTHTVNGTLMPAGKQFITLTFAGLIRQFACGELDDDQTDLMYLLGSIIEQNGLDNIRDEIEATAFEHFGHNELAGDVARALYGEVLQTSISRLEKYASCAYAHFLAYGMRLKERSEFGFERADMGDVYHKVLEQFAKKLKEEKLGWNEYTSEQSDVWVDEILGELSKVYGETVLLSSERTKAMTGRMNRILKRTMDTLGYQIGKGSFVPIEFEKNFSNVYMLSDALDKEKIKMKVSGKIDRIDLFEKGGKLFIRIVDYKSGNKDFDITSLYHGLSLQLAVYMNEAVKFEKKATGLTDVEPAAMLYYHIDDPMIEDEADISEEALRDKLHGELRMKGVLSNDRDKLCYMDNSLAASGANASDVIPVSITAKDEVKETSSVFDDNDLNELLLFAENKTRELAKAIFDGDISAKPCSAKKGMSPCDYCDFSSICKIDSQIPGYEKITYDKMDKLDAIERMRTDNKGMVD